MPEQELWYPYSIHLVALDNSLIVTGGGVCKLSDIGHICAEFYQAQYIDLKPWKLEFKLDPTNGKTLKEHCQ